MAIVEANVGVTMAISKGEVVALSRKETTITYASIDIPGSASRANRDLHESRSLAWRRQEMRARYEKPWRGLAGKERSDETRYIP